MNISSKRIWTSPPFIPSTLVQLNLSQLSCLISCPSGNYRAGGWGRAWDELGGGARRSFWVRQGPGSRMQCLGWGQGWDGMREVQISAWPLQYHLDTRCRRRPAVRQPWAKPHSQESRSPVCLKGPTEVPSCPKRTPPLLSYFVQASGTTHNGRKFILSCNRNLTSWGSSGWLLRDQGGWELLPSLW